MEQRPIAFIDGFPIYSVMWAPEEYEGIDAGVRFAVKVLHAAGIKTGQSCQGGAGHSYPEPTVDLMTDGADDALGFAALAALRAYGLPVSSAALMWNVVGSRPDGPLWRISFARTMEDRADGWPMFERLYRPRPDTAA